MTAAFFLVLHSQIRKCLLFVARPFDTLASIALFARNHAHFLAAPALASSSWTAPKALNNHSFILTKCPSQLSTVLYWQKTLSSFNELATVDTVPVR